MTNMVQIYFIRRLNRGNFMFQATVLKFSDLLFGMKVGNKCKNCNQNYAS